MDTPVVQQTEIITAKRAVQFATKEVSPPSPLYVQQGEQLQFSLIALGYLVPYAVTISTRFLRPDGEIIPQIETLQVNVAFLNKAYTLQEGFLLSVCVQLDTGNGPSVGGYFAHAFLLRGSSTIVGPSTHMLLADYYSAQRWACWPLGRTIEPQDGPGAIRAFNTAAPGAGAEVSITVPTRTRWRLIALKLRLVTAVAAATRSVRLTLDDGATIYAILPPPATQIASLTRDYTWTDGGVQFDDTNGVMIAHLPTGVRLTAAHRIRTATLAIQGADQYSLIQALVEEWIDY
jgi:hypothetical protein